MGLEVPAYVPDLNSANPPNTDQRKQGDDHLRIIKTAVKQSLELFGGGLTTGGTSTAYTVATGHVNTPTYKDGHLYAIALHTANGASATINYDSQGARTFKKLNVSGSWVDLAANDYPAGTLLLFYYEGGDTTFRIIAASMDPLKYLPEVGGTVNGNVTLRSTDGGATQAPSLSLIREGGSQAANDFIGGIAFRGQNTTPATIDYANFVAQVMDATPGSVDGSLHLQVAIASVMTTILQILGDSVQANTKILSTDGTNSVTLTGNDGGIELLKTTGSAYIDFKNSSGDDFDARLAQDSGNAGVSFNAAGTGVTVLMNSTGVRSATTAKAWITGGYSGGVPSAAQAYNVASITDVGTGQPRMNFTTAMSTASAAAVASAVSAGTVAHAAVAVLNTAYTELQLFDSSHALADLTFLMVQFDGTT